MRVAIDIRRVKDFGVGTYIRNVVRTLARIGREHEYLLIGAPRHVHELGELPPNFLTEVNTLPESSTRNFFKMQLIMRRYRCDLAHVPHLYWIPRFTPCPYVITVHDLLEHFTRTPNLGTEFRRSLHFALTRRVLHRASRILAVSNSTAKEITQAFGVPEQKVEVIYNAIDERFRRGHATEAEREMIAQRYQVNYPFLLYAGNIKSHKNIVRLIEAFSLLKQELRKEGRLADLKLIIIGNELAAYPDLRRTVIKSRMQNDVRFLGFVPIDTLRIFYDVAKIFVFPSLYEGFGLPPLEAMAHGTPVVTSNTTSLPEVVGDAAVLVNPENVFEISRALHRVLLDQELRDQMKARGYKQAARFSWEESVRKILRVYTEAAENSA